MFIHILLILLASLLPTVLSQRSDCVTSCVHLEDPSAYEACIVRCSDKPREDNVPMGVSEWWLSFLLLSIPPISLSITTFECDCHHDGSHWCGQDIGDNCPMESRSGWEQRWTMHVIIDASRTAFYLRYTSIGQACQEKFPGYYTTKIKPVSGW